MPHMAFKGLGSLVVVVAVLDFAGFGLRLLGFRDWGYSPVVDTAVAGDSGCSGGGSRSSSSRSSRRCSSSRSRSRSRSKTERERGRVRVVVIVVIITTTRE